MRHKTCQIGGLSRDELDEDIDAIAAGLAIGGPQGQELTSPNGRSGIWEKSLSRLILVLKPRPPSRGRRCKLVDEFAAYNNDGFY